MTPQLVAQRQRLADRMDKYVASQYGQTLKQRQERAAKALACSLRTVQKAMAKPNAKADDKWMLGADTLTTFCEKSLTSADYLLLGTVAAAGLPGALASHVADEVGRRLPRVGPWKSFVSYWRADGRAIIEQAIERELECFRRASEGLDELAKSLRPVVQEQVELRLAPAWPVRGQTPAERQTARRDDQQRRRALVESLVRALTHAEFTRRVNESGAALIHDPEQLDRQRAELANPLTRLRRG